MKKILLAVAIGVSTLFFSGSGVMGEVYAVTATSRDFSVAYHADDNSAALSATTRVTFGVSTKTKTISDLKIKRSNCTFLGWKAYRDMDDKWLLKDSSGNQSWKSLVNGELPAGHTFSLLKDGVSLAKTSSGGTVHFYAQWFLRDFNVFYHKDDESTPLSTKTTVTYGVSTKTKTISELKITRSDQTFLGWKAYRSMDNKWLLKDGSGNQAWMSVNNGKLPAGYEYSLLKSGVSLAKTSSGGEVHFYGQWKSKDFVVAYHADDNSAELSTKTKVPYGVSTKTKKTGELGIKRSDSIFTGWKAYRDMDDKWLLKDSNGKQSWMNLVKGDLPAGYEFSLLKDGVSLAKTSAGGTVHFYAQWKSKDFTVAYHETDNSDVLSVTTTVPYGVSTRTKTISDLGLESNGKVFIGWKGYRDMDDKWLLKDGNGNQSWMNLNKGNLPAGYEYSLLKDGVSLAKTSAGGTVHLYGQWNASFIDVSKFGINGDGSRDVVQDIQKCLDYAKQSSDHIEVFIPAGEYHISKSLIIYSGTTLRLDENAVIIRDDPTTSMLRSYSDQKTGGYGQAHDINVIGGVWNGNVTDPTILGISPLMTFKHAQNINLESFEIGSFCSRHAITISGVKDCNIKNLTIRDQVQFTGNDADHEYYRDYADEDFSEEKSLISMEALHVDYISTDGLSEPAALPWDGTVCENIVVDNCRFENVFSGVGGHYTADNAPKNNGLTVTNCQFNNIRCACIHPVNYDNVMIEGNVAQDAGCLVRINKSQGIINNNVAHIRKTSYIIDEYDQEEKSLALSAILVYDNSDVIIKNNEIYSPSNSGISVHSNSVVSEISNNKVESPRNHGITVYQSSVGIIGNNTVISSDGNGINVNNGEANVTGNTVNGSKGSGIVIATGKGTICGNTVNEAKKWGILCTNSSTVGSVNKNTVNKASKHAIAFYYGSSASEVKDNKLTEAGENGIIFESSNADTLSGNEVSNVGGNGIHMYGSHDADIYNNTVSKPGVNGIVINNGSSNITVGNNTISAPGSNGICILNGSEASAIGNTVEGALNDGFVIKESTASVEDNNVSNVARYGIVTDNGSNVVILRNIIENVQNDGINVAGSFCKIIENTIRSVNNGVILHDIHPSSEGQVQVQNNMIGDGTEKGICLQDVDLATVSDNTVNSSLNTGILLKRTNNSLVSGNNVKESKVTGINLTGDNGSSIISGNTVSANVVTADPVSNNINHGIVINYAADTDVSYNEASGFKKGISVQNAENAIVNYNSSSDNEYGFLIQYVRSSVVNNNTAINNVYGILASNDTGLSVVSNTSTGNSTMDVLINKESTGSAENNVVGEKGIKTYDRNRFPVF